MIASALATIQRDPHDAAAWRALDRWTRERWPTRGVADRDDARQLALMTIWRSAGDVHDLHPRAAEVWLWRVWNARLAETKRRRPFLRLAHEVVAPRPPLPARPLRELLTEIDRRVAATVEGERNAVLHRVQARAAVLRIIFGHDSATLGKLLFVGGAGRDVLAKWVERGRGVVLRALHGWAADNGDEDVIETLRELMTERLASGAPRARRAA